jgi:hypothetical protein
MRWCGMTTAAIQAGCGGPAVSSRKPWTRTNETPPTCCWALLANGKRAGNCVALHNDQPARTIPWGTNQALPSTRPMCSWAQSPHCPSMT